MDMKKQNRTYLVLPLLAFSINGDGSKEIDFGWLNYTWTLIFN
jgi:hypothetical protein